MQAEHADEPGAPFFGKRTVLAVVYVNHLLPTYCSLLTRTWHAANIITNRPAEDRDNHQRNVIRFYSVGERGHDYIKCTLKCNTPIYGTASTPRMFLVVSIACQPGLVGWLIDD
jgi:hypothetical protein